MSSTLRAYISDRERCVTWGLVALLAVFYESVRASQSHWHKVIKRDSSNWEVLCELLRLPYEGLWHESSLQYEARHGPDAAALVFVVSEQTATTLGMLIVVLSFVMLRRSNADKKRGAAMLLQLLKLFVGEGEGDQGQLYSNVAHWGARGVCDLGGDSRGCVHFRQILQAHPGTDPHWLLHSVVVGLGASAFACERCRVALGALLRRLAQHIEGRIDEIPFEFSALKHGRSGLARRRCRVDAAFEDALRRTVKDRRSAAARRGGRTCECGASGSLGQEGSQAYVCSAMRWLASLRCRAVWRLAHAGGWRSTRPACS